jgi:hypothetical protein
MVRTKTTTIPLSLLGLEGKVFSVTLKGDNIIIESAVDNKTKVRDKDFEAWLEEEHKYLDSIKL